MGLLSPMVSAGSVFTLLRGLLSALAWVGDWVFWPQEVAGTPPPSETRLEPQEVKFCHQDPNSLGLGSLLKQVFSFTLGWA